MEMDFAVLVPSDDLANEEGDEQLRTALAGLGELESAMNERH
jgi:type IV secretion system protein VirD4